MSRVGLPPWPEREADATPAWLERVLTWMRDNEDSFVVLFQLDQSRASTLDDEWMFAPSDMSEPEYRAIVDGYHRRLLNDDDAWNDLIALLEEPAAPSLRFRRVLAALIRAGALHPRGERGLATKSARERRDYIVAILRHAYGKRDNFSQQRAADVIAHEVRRPAETFDAARQRVTKALSRGLREPRVSDVILRSFKARA